MAWIDTSAPAHHGPKPSGVSRSWVRTAILSWSYLLIYLILGAVGLTLRPHEPLLIWQPAIGLAMAMVVIDWRTLPAVVLAPLLACVLVWFEGETSYWGAALGLGVVQAIGLGALVPIAQRLKIPLMDKPDAARAMLWIAAITVLAGLWIGVGSAVTLPGISPDLDAAHPYPVLDLWGSATLSMLTLGLLILWHIPRPWVGMVATASSSTSMGGRPATSQWGWIDSPVHHAVIVGAVLVLTLAITMSDPAATQDWPHQLAMLCFLPLVWAAMAFGRSGAVVVATTILATLTIQISIRQVVAMPPGELHTFMLVLTATGLIVGTLSDHDRQRNDLLREAQSRLEQLSRHLSEGFWLYDVPSDRTVYCSQAVAELVGQAMAPGARGWPIPIDQVASNHRHRLIQAQEEAASGQDVELEIEVVADGASDLASHLMGQHAAKPPTRWLSIKASVIRDRQTQLVRGLAGTMSDVTERRRTNEALSHSEASLRAIFDSHLQSFIIADASYRITDINWVAQEITLVSFGRRASKGDSIIELIDSDYRRTFELQFSRALAGESLVVERQMLDRLGNALWFELSFMPVRDATGQVWGVCVGGIEISERKRVEQALTESESRFRAMFDNAAVGVATFDLQGRFLRANAELSRIFQLVPRQLRGRSFGAFTHPDDVSSSARVFQEIAAGQSETHRLEKRYFRTDGQLIWTTVSLSLVRDANGKPDFIVGIFEDVTDRRRMERSQRDHLQFLQTLLDTIPNPIFYKDRDGRYLNMNRAMETFMRTPRSRLLGRTVHETADQTSVHIHKEHDDALLRRPGSTTYQITVQREGADPRQVIIHKATYTDADGRIAGIVGLITDITDQKRTEQSLRQSEDLLRKVIESVPTGIWTADRDFNVQLWNAGQEMMTGWSRQQVIGQNIFSMFPALTQHGLEQAYRQVIETGEPLDLQDFAFEDERLSFGSYYLNIRARPLTDVEGHVTGIVVAVEDITSQRQSLLALQAERDRSQTYLDTAQVLFVAVNRSGLLTMVNRRACELLGLDETELLNRRFADVFSAGNDADKVHAQIIEQMDRVDQDLPYTEFTALTNSGQRRVIAWRNALLHDTQGDVMGMLASGADITEQKQAQEHLQLISEAVDSSSDAICITDSQRRVVHMNPAWVNLWGYQAEQLDRLEGPAASLEDPSEGDALTHALVSGQSWQGDLTVHTRQRQRMLMSCRADVIGSPTGHQLGLLMVLSDTTERRRAELAMRDSERRFRMLFEHSPEGIIVHDDQGLIVDANTAAEKLLGCEHHGLIGRKLETLFPESHRQPLRQELDRSWRGRVADFQTQILVDGQRTRHVQVSATGIEYDARPALLLHLRDITDRTHAEQQLRQTAEQLNAVLEAAPLPAMALDLQGRVQFIWNTAAEAALGVSQVEAIDQPLSNLSSPPGQLEQLLHLVHNQNAVVGDEITLTDHLQQERVFSVFAAPLRDVGSKVIGYVVLMLDVTQRRQAENEREVLEAELRQAQKLKALGTLASGVAHDFNNLLTAIYGYSSLARKNVEEKGQAAQALEMIERVCEQAGGLTQSLLTFARKAPSDKAEVELGQLAADSMKLLRRLLPASIELKLNNPGDQPVWIYGDRSRIQQVLINLTINARDAMADGGRLTFEVRSDHHGIAEVDYQGPTAELVVSDTGIGMPEELRSRVFEPFFTTKARGQGTGLGLAVVHGIVIDHGGAIEVTSQQDKGTRFTIRIPCCDPPEDQQSSEEQLAQIKGNGELILVAEDQPYVREIIVSSLRSSGFAVEGVGDGDAFTQKVQDLDGSLRAAVLDLDLPKKPGLVCLKDIEATHPSLPVVVITGNVDRHHPQLERSHVELLAKPFQMSNLIRTVAHAIEDTSIAET